MIDVWCDLAVIHQVYVYLITLSHSVWVLVALIACFVGHIIGHIGV